MMSMKNILIKISEKVAIKYLDELCGAQVEGRTYTGAKKLLPQVRLNNSSPFNDVNIKPDENVIEKREEKLVNHVY
ncbi:hypothetical protein ISS39_11105 [Candidatus Bathyarchaeota archaeon]|nr:hypothetical protein [Candidatus Bathyarchaeota archaeon]